ncbi:PrsW family glutamic-type intramembrane protease [Terasakiella sp. A23]|uniref:PrsW family intramembrane metalloprotease n=1 Tax=Terasakiella sp. FCG-A23 TaxID=3080561 RepID=UPI002954BFAC|nr:PrsW family glutamic-type intramembrane protease [Terasakiella sp. A23]MDV7340542.1 PrsW family glutamic-type intramembrane protease [Terasakiella sp. A23]
MDDSLVRLVAFSAAVLPAEVILVYFMTYLNADILDETVWAGFGFGACAAFPAILLALGAMTIVNTFDGVIWQAMGKAFLGASIPEEICKFLTIVCLFHKQLKKLSPSHIFLVAIAVSTGFACLENIFYVIEDESWGVLALMRSLSAVPGHAFVGAVMGYCIVQAQDPDRQSVTWWALGLTGPIILHGLYDFPLVALDGGVADQEVLLYVLLFLLVVVLEGGLAHYYLKSFIGAEENAKNPMWEPANMLKAVRWANATACNHWHWIFWALVCFFLATGLLFGRFHMDHDTGYKIYYVTSFAVFAVLHGCAFVALAMISRRRKKARQFIHS